MTKPSATPVKPGGFAPGQPPRRDPGGRTRHGWFAYASEDPAAPVPDDLAAVMRPARQRDCEYVVLDVDAPPMADLPVLHPDFPEASTPV